jgi:hypothetical protein
MNHESETDSRCIDSLDHDWRCGTCRRCGAIDITPNPLPEIPKNLSWDEAFDFMASAVNDYIRSKTT